MPVGYTAAGSRASQRLLLLLASLSLSFAARAATFPNLYSVTVNQDPAAADQRAAATQAAFTAVLVRVTGNRYAGLDPELKTLIGDASRYTTQYGTDRQGRAIVGFNATRVDQALAGLNVRIWGSERPLTLVWAAVDDGQGGRALLGSGDGPADATPATVELLTMLRTELAAVADERGLPMVLPQLDSEDLAAITLDDVSNGLDDRVVAASARYRADAVLIGRVHPGLVGTEVEWRLLKDGEPRKVEGTTVRDGLDAVADQYASELSGIGDATTSLLRVLDVKTPADYGRVMSYLEKVTSLRSVDVESLERGTLTVRVAARGDARVLERVLALGGVLRPDAATPGAGALVFRIASPGAR
jgi:uncharacterized protein